MSDGIDILTLSAAKSFTVEVLDGVTLIEGKPCTIQSITDIEGGKRVTFAWTDDNGVAKTSTMDVMNGEKGDDGEQGYSPVISVKESTQSSYKLHVENEDGGFDTPNLKGTGAGVTDYNALDNIPKVNNVSLTGNKTSAELGIATKTSDLNNDSGFITNTVNNLVNYYLKSETYTKAEVEALIAAISTMHFEVVNELPTTDIQTNAIYLVPKSTAQTNNVKDEYINPSGTTSGWEKIGDTEIDLSGYVTTTALNTALADYVTNTNLTTTLAGYATTSALADKVDKVSGKGLSTEDYTTAEKALVANSIQKSVTSGLMKNDGTVDTTQYLSQHQDITGKADKVANATNGNFAGLDANGNLTDSGKKASDFASSAIMDGQSIDSFGDVETALGDKQPKTLATPLTIGGTQQTTVEGALGALNNAGGGGSSASYVAHTIAANGWDANNVYSFETQYPNASYDIEEIYPNESTTDAQSRAWNNTGCNGYYTTNIIKAKSGVVPSVDIPVTLKLKAK